MHKRYTEILIAMCYTQTLLLAFGLMAVLPTDVLAERGKLKADCIIQIKGTKTGQTRLTVMPGTTPAYVLTPEDLHFVLELALDETYLLTFEHPNCVTKQLYVDATVPLAQRTKDFDFPLKVVLEHHEEPFTYAGPVGFIYYEHSITDFSYHTEYAINVSERFEERMAELERTGVDPRSATLGYTASTSPSQLRSASPKDDVSMPVWGTLAPTVAHVGPMVHRLGKAESVAREPAIPVLPVLSVPVVAPAVTPATPKLAKPIAIGNRPEPITERPTREVEASILEHMFVPNDAGSSAQTCTYELIVEERRITTIFLFTDKAMRSTEFRRVLHHNGAVYYFQDNRSISEYTYDQATRSMKEMAVSAESLQ